MKWMITVGICFFNTNLVAQLPANQITEGGKVLIELVKVFKKTPTGKTDPGGQRGGSDLCYNNTSNNDLLIEFSVKVNDSMYKPLPNPLNLKANSQECLLELSPGIYHYKIYRKEGQEPMIYLEGDIRLKANEKMERKIR
ncbi:MAG TPA: hypothetical protein PLC48_04425 [Ferruginibacter sp.]|mgnify:FL=1|jgi:hypothetical protein|nr:hypothetical protein [Ferruginibacter sp.]